MKVSRVVVATDLGDGADEAIRLADVWARRYGAALVALHVVPELVGVNVLFPQRSDQERELMRVLCERAHGAVARRVTALTGRGRDAFTIEILRGAPVREILAAITSLSADLLVVGESGPRGILRVPTARTVAQLVRDAPIPVLVARAAPDWDVETNTPRPGRGVH